MALYSPHIINSDSYGLPLDGPTSEPFVAVVVDECGDFEVLCIVANSRKAAEFVLTAYCEIHLLSVMDFACDDECGDEQFPDGFGD